LKRYGEIDSKFRFVILASKRAKQLLQGAKPRIKSKSKNPIRIAQKEVRDGFIDYEEMEEVKPEARKAKEEKPEQESKVAEKKKPVKKVAKAKEKKPVKKAAKKSGKKETTQEKKT